MKIKLVLAIAAVVLLANGTAQASFNFSTGVHVNGDGTDQLWRITSIQAGANVDNSNRPAYVAGPVSQFPLNGGVWVPNSAESKWITYSTPLNVGPDVVGVTYTYTLSFYTTGGSGLSLKWLSDNNSEFYLDGALAGSSPNLKSYQGWTTYNFADLAAGSYTLDFVVHNEVLNSPDPSGLRVEFFAPVPEPSTLVAGALLLLPFGAGAIRSIRKNRTK